MPHFLQNEHLAIHIDLPTERYNLSRFDWTGKIVDVTFHGKRITGTEFANPSEHPFCGRGLYNEFGIDSPLGYNETNPGGWVPKIGIGALKKDDNPYHFHHPYECRPAEFDVEAGTDRLRMICQSQPLNGYAYRLEKELVLFDSSFEIRYTLENTGSIAIVTDEYTHNFLAIDHELVGRNYTLTFPFQLDPESMGEHVNPEGLVKIAHNEIHFLGTPKQPFFFSNLSGGQSVPATWRVENPRSRIGICETGSFQTQKVNLWGWGHVISPELFVHLDIPAGQSAAWSRTYEVYHLS